MHYMCTKTHTHEQNVSFNCPRSVPHFDPVSIKKKRKTIMSHSRRCHPMLFTVLPVLQTKASSLSAGTELGAAATTVSSLYQQAKLLNNTDLLGNTDAIFFLNRPSPFHSSHPSLPSLCPLLGATIPSLSLFHSAAAAKAERSCQHTLLLFDSCFFLSQSFTLKYSS